MSSKFHFRLTLGRLPADLLNRSTDTEQSTRNHFDNRLKKWHAAVKNSLSWWPRSSYSFNSHATDDNFNSTTYSSSMNIDKLFLTVNYSKNTWPVMKYATLLSEMTYLKLVKFGTSWLCYRLNNEKRLKKSKSIACFSFSFLICNFSW